MNRTTETRIRKLEAELPPKVGPAVFLGWPGRPDPAPEEIAAASYVAQLRFIRTGDDDARD